MQYIWIDADCEFSEISCTFVCIEEMIYPLIIVGRRVYYFAILYFKYYVFKSKSLFLLWSVIGNFAVYGIAYRSRVYFAVGNVSESVAFYGRNPLD